MKKIFYLSLSLVLLLLGFEFLGSSSCSIAKANNKFISDSTKTSTLSLSISGMTCPKCAETITNYLKKDKGIISSDINYKNKINTITYDPAKINEKEIIEKIKKSGHNAKKADKEEHKTGSVILKCADGCNTTK